MSSVYPIRRFLLAFTACQELEMALQERSKIVFPNNTYYSTEKRMAKKTTIDIKSMFDQIDILTRYYISLEHQSYLSDCLALIIPDWIPTRFCPKFSADAFNQRRHLLSLMTYPVVGTGVESRGWYCGFASPDQMSLAALLAYWNAHGMTYYRIASEATMILRANGKINGSYTSVSRTLRNTFNAQIEAVLLVTAYQATLPGAFSWHKAGVFPCDLVPGVYRPGAIGQNATYTPIDSPDFGPPEISMSDFDEIPADQGVQKIIYYRANNYILVADLPAMGYQFEYP